MALSRPANTGVVPKREWGEAKTVVTEGIAQGKAAEKASDVSTDNHFSPWAKTNVEHEPPVTEPTLDLASPAPVKPTTGSRVRFHSSRGLELPTVAASPDEVLASQPAATSQSTLPPLEVSPGEQTDRATAAPASRIPLYIALLSAIVALLAGLIWLVSQR